jgi:diguanylate cyclase (GGDEF)-like protein
MAISRPAKKAPPKKRAAKPTLKRVQTLVDSYRRLADIFHDVLSEQTLDPLLDKIADTLAELIPYDSFTIYQADEPRRLLTPLMARDKWATEIMNARMEFGEGITGWAVERREPVLVPHAHLDPRVSIVPGTPADEPEALISVPLVARGKIKGALNVYRLGDDAAFSEDEFELAKRFGDAAALALDNAQVRAVLELQAQTDSLTGLFNHRYFHERLRAELNRASRAQEAIGVLMVDIDDFKRVNDVHGHGTGDQVLAVLADILRGSVRSSDVVCRLGGEEFGVIMAPCKGRDALTIAGRITDNVARTSFEPAGRLTVSMGISQGPEHAMNPRELVACAEAAMMTAKARGKNQTVLFDEEATERPDASSLASDDVRSIAHLKMLQSLAGKLNRLNDVREIGNVIVDELRLLIDYHNCRVYIAEGDDLVPTAFKGSLGEYGEENVENLWCKVGEGITGRAAATGQSLLINDALHCEFAADVPGTDDVDESIIAVPLCYGSRVIGVVVISKLGVDRFDEDDVRLLEVLGGHASVALENARLYEAERNEAENAKASLEIANALLEVSRELATAETLEEVVTRVVELTVRTVGGKRASVWLQDSEIEDVTIRATYGHDEEERDRLAELRYDPVTARKTLNRAEPFLLPPDQLGSIDGAYEVGDLTFAVAPLKLDAGRLGCIVVGAPIGELESSEPKLRLLAGLAHQAKLAIANAGSFKSLEDTFLSTIEALANALEANDQYTSAHARWIKDMAVGVGRELGLDAKSIKRLELGAIFHDIGKIGIPSSVLAKPGPLTFAERELMETHPELGERILEPIARLHDVRDIVRHCHERWDGTGYPDGLGGEEIPVEARIIFVCDAFHAMTTDRPYRPRLTPEEACRRLDEASGTQFDPRIVEIFLRIVPAALATNPV